MFIGVIVFVVGNRHYVHADIRKPQEAGTAGVGTLLSSVLLPAIATGIAGWFIPANIFGSDSTDAFIFGSLPVVTFYLWTLHKAAAADKPRLRALLSIYAVVIIFWAVFKQNGTALTTWAEFYTDRSMPTLVEPGAAALGMVQVVHTDSSLVPAYDSGFRSQRSADGKVVKIRDIDPYFINIPPQERPAPGASVSLFVVIFTPLLIAFFARLRKRRREPTTPAKIGWGLVISALSTLVTVMAVYACHNGAEKASSWWLIATYGVVTVGELCLSPMGLSMVSKMAPAHLTGLMMGGWQLATSLGNKLSGVLATMWDRYDHKADFFWVNFVLLGLASVVLFSMLKWLNRIFRDQGLS
jgi:POT family proton-dependent oligopeptide transporter